jgi:hypothetical protein
MIMQAACGNLHALLFSSGSFEDPVLTPSVLSDARSKLNVSDLVVYCPDDTIKGITLMPSS